MKENEKLENETNKKKLNENQMKEKENKRVGEMEKMDNWDKGRNEVKKYINGLL
jgi:hypothetical protein